MSGSMLKADARKILFENTPRIFLISIIYVILASVLSWLTYNLPGSMDFRNYFDSVISGRFPSIRSIFASFRPFGIFLSFLLSLLQPIVEVGFISYCLKVKRKRATAVKDIFNGFNIFVKVLVIFIVTSFFVFLWSLLLIIPGVIASYRYRMAYYILLDDPSKGAFECIEESIQIMYGGKLDLFIIDLSFIGWYLLDIAAILLIPLPFVPPLISIWTSPYRGITLAGFYEFRTTRLAG